MKQWITATTGKRGSAAVLPIGVRQQSVLPADDFAEKAEASQDLHARGEFHVRWRHLEDVRAAGDVVHVGSSEKARERLAGQAYSVKDSDHESAPYEILLGKLPLSSTTGVEHPDAL